MPDTPLRVRFAPSPTGYLHVGGARTALFNWLLARRTGGQFILRIEDTDQSRHVEDSVAKIGDDLRWLGLNWDEGPDVGGDGGPYLQSRRLDLYHAHVDRLIEEGHAYYALETSEELQAKRELARREKRNFRYERPAVMPTPDQVQAARTAGQQIPVRFKMPQEDIVFTDEILGEVRVAGEEMEDFIILKGDGWPTYHLACAVDDELMRINMVIRGQEHLINTPKHIALQRAFGYATPRYAHLPIIFNEDGTKMSKRTAIKDLSVKIRSARQKRGNPAEDVFAAQVAKGAGLPLDAVHAVLNGKHDVIDDVVRGIAAHLEVDLLEINVHDFRAAGYLPEALINFLSLLGWSPGEDREQMDLAETTRLFDISRVGKTNARFDRAKLLAFNTDWLNKLPAERIAEALDDYLSVTGSAFSRASAADKAKLIEICRGFRTFKELDSKCRFLFEDDADIQFDAKAVKKVLAANDGAGFQTLAAILPRLESAGDWSTEALEQLFEQICSEMDTKLGHVAQPVRVAISGTTISPPIFETLVILGQPATLRRIQRCLQLPR